MRPTFPLLSNDLHRCFITHCLHRRRAPLFRPHCTTDYHGLEVVSTLPRWYYLDDGDHIFFWNFSLSSRLPCESSKWTSSFVSTSQAMFSAINWRCALFFFLVIMMKMPLQVNSYGSADFLDDMNQEVFTRVQECVSVYLFVLFFLGSFKSLLSFPIFSIFLVQHLNYPSQTKLTPLSK